MGVYGNQPSYAIGYPSPPPPPGSAPVVNTSCGADKKVVLSEIAKGTAFTVTCLVAAPGKAFSVNFDNQDASIPHNMAFFSDSGFTKLIYRGNVITGPATAVYPATQTSGPLSAGTYYFHCDVHPTMQGTLVVVAGAK
jgi:plastocyanin